MSDPQRAFFLWAGNIVILLVLTLLSWNANRICDDVDQQATEIQRLKQESVRWAIVADDVKEMKADVKRLLLRVQP